jgi:hypothetical protein
MKRGGGWLAPRSGGYTPGNPKVTVSNKAPKPPKGGAGVKGTNQDRRTR